MAASEPTLPAVPSPDSQGKLDRSESILYLRTFLPSADKSSEVELDRLAGYLGDQSFALNLAIGYLKEKGRTTVREYLAQIDNTAITLDPAISDWANGCPEAPTSQMAAIVLMSYRLLEGKGEREQTARQTFFTAGHFAPDLPVPMDIIRQRFEIVKNRQSIFDRSLQWLYSLGLLIQSDQGPIIPSLLNGFARSTDPDPSGTLSALAEALLTLPLDMEATDPALAAIIVHLRTAAAQAESAGLKQAGALWNSLGYFLWVARDLNEAKACLERSLDINERAYGAAHADIAIALSNLGHVVSDLGDYRAAKNCFDRAMSINEKVFSASYPGVAVNANDLGQVLYESGDLAGARACFERAVTVHETAFGYGPKHSVIATEAGNLGRVLRDLGDLQGAKANFERALAVDEWTYGSRHPSIAIRANYLGRVLYQLGDLQGAKTNFERAVAIEKANPENESTILANVLNNLALVLQDLGSLAEARDCFQQVLAIDEKLHGPEHPTVAKDIASLGNIERDLGNYTAARDWYNRAIKINEIIYGTVHPTTSANVKNLGRVLYSLGDLPDAKEAYQRALEIDTSLLGVEHVEVGTDLHNMGMVLYELGALQEAKTYYERALSIFEKRLPADSKKRNKALQHLERVKKRLRPG